MVKTAFWLKIEQFWPFEEISIFSNGGHLGYRMALTDIILKGDHLRIIPTLYPRWPPLLKIDISSNGQNCFILSLNVPKFELYKHNDGLFILYCHGGHLGYRMALMDTILKGDHPRIISAKFG
jgi:hypothetical protein